MYFRFIFLPYATSQSIQCGGKHSSSFVPVVGPVMWVYAFPRFWGQFWGLSLQVLSIYSPNTWVNVVCVLWLATCPGILPVLEHPHQHLWVRSADLFSQFPCNSVANGWSNQKHNLSQPLWAMSAVGRLNRVKWHVAMNLTAPHCLCCPLTCPHLGLLLAAGLWVEGVHR